MAQPETDPRIAQLRDRIRSTAEAADRLAGEAFGGPGPSAGPGRARAADEAAQEAQALVALVRLLRDLLPDELRQQVLDLVRQVLVLVRAIIDFSLQRLEVPRTAEAARGPVVEDIPLD